MRIASITSPTGAINVREWVAAEIRRIRCARRWPTATVDGGDGAPEIDRRLGRARPDAREQVFGWNSFEVLAFKHRQSGGAGQRDPAHGLGDAASSASSSGVDPDEFLPALRRHLDAHGFPMVEVERCGEVLLRRDAARSRASLGAMGARPRSRRRPARSRRCCPISAVRCRTTSSPRSWPAHGMGAAFLSRLLAACAGRAHAGAGGARGAEDHGRDLLGSRRGWRARRG